MLVLDKLEMTEVELLFCTTNVGDANSAHGHATQFIASVNHLIFIVVVQESNLLPSAIRTETLELEERRCAHLAKAEVHATERYWTICGEGEMRTHGPSDDFVRRSHLLHHRC